MWLFQDTLDRSFRWKKLDLTTVFMCWSNLKEESRVNPKLVTAGLIYECRFPTLTVFFSFPTEGPNTIASVLLALRCRTFEDIQDRISFRQASKISKPFLSVCLKGRSIWVPSAYKWKDTVRIEPRGNIYIMKTELGTTWILEEHRK